MSFDVPMSSGAGFPPLNPGPDWNVPECLFPVFSACKGNLLSNGGILKEAPRQRCHLCWQVYADFARTQIIYDHVDLIPEPKYLNVPARL